MEIARLQALDKTIMQVRTLTDPTVKQAALVLKTVFKEVKVGCKTRGSHRAMEELWDMVRYRASMHSRRKVQVL